MAQLSQLLLFDPDPSGLDTLTYGFEKDGCSVTGTSDPRKARELVQSASPSLLIVNLRDQEQVGLDLLRSTAGNPRTRNLACVAIGKEELRSAAQKAGAFVFLSVPLFVRDVIGVCHIIAAAVVPGSRPSPDREVSLKLEELNGIYFLVRALAVAGRSAVVEARHGQNRGELRFMEGALTSAEVGSVRGLPALHHMLLWEDASLHFKFRNVVRRGAQLSMKSSEVLEECDRFLRDFAHEAKELGFARTIYSAELDRVQPSPALPSEVVPILKLFDGRRDLAHILDESPFRIFDTLKIVKRFATDGAIQLKTPLPAARAAVDPVSGAGGPSALDDWLQRSSPPMGHPMGSEVNGGAQVSQPPPATTAAPVTGVAPRPTNSAGRPSSPFVALDPTGAGAAQGTSSAIPQAIPVGSPRARTVTKKNSADPSPSVDAAAVPTPAQFPEDMITPPPVIRVEDTPSKPVSAVVRGEIRITPVPQRRDAAPPATALPTQSVVVELGPLPAPVPLTSNAPPPVSAQAQPVPSPPSVIIAPMTPPPVLLAPDSSIPVPVPAVAASPVAIPVEGDSGKRHPRSPSDSFSPVESDFFEREADLYKRESVETFDDLDHSNGTRKR